GYGPGRRGGPPPTTAGPASPAMADRAHGRDLGVRACPPGRRGSTWPSRRRLPCSPWASPGWRRAW
ncbi:MAG TPA: hypothetical protein VGH88_09800, partial [Streptosporangiaceae bacterium]